MIPESPSKATSARRAAIRREIVKMAEHSAHVAAALSCVDILSVLYLDVLRLSPQLRNAPHRDRFVLSKGHAAMALYAVLAHAGFIDNDELATYARNGSCLAEHPLADKVPGVEMATGSLGHGLAVAAGMAWSLRRQDSPARVFVLVGDGECDEGSVWEAAAAASANGLGHLTAVVDWNGLQACNACSLISGAVSLPAAWAAFGWAVEETDGHDPELLRAALERPDPQGRPRAVLARTIKGKGVDFMENNLEWHYRPVRGEERQRALERLADA